MPLPTAAAWTKASRELVGECVHRMTNNPMVRLLMATVVVLGGFGWLLFVSSEPYWTAKFWGKDAELPGASLRNADLNRATLSGVNLHGADLRGAHLQGAELGGSD